MFVYIHTSNNEKATRSTEAYILSKNLSPIIAGRPKIHVLGQMRSNKMSTSLFLNTETVEFLITLNGISSEVFTPE